ncbi:MAG TPA: histidine utilization repressor [Beijerinckiaceae bacterium]|nr:histidine utilization repressor [Beijerinckiaceae bacterium]
MDHADPIPRYLEIQRDLQDRIASGEWPPGHRVPPEHELQARYGCSRMTVNKALSTLAGVGLIERRRRSGSFVAAPKSQQTILKIHDIKAEIAASGRPYRFSILSRTRRRMSADDATRLGIAQDGEVEALDVIHFAGETPFVMEERLINLKVAPGARGESFVDSPPGTWLLNLVPWTDAEHIIRAEPVSGPMALRLAMSSRGACLVIERRTWQAGEAITWVKLTYPGERHRLTSRFSPGDRIGG